MAQGRDIGNYEFHCTKNWLAYDNKAFKNLESFEFVVSFSSVLLFWVCK